jgi:glycolate oxidase FAD binding subunit
MSIRSTESGKSVERSCRFRGDGLENRRESDQYGCNLASESQERRSRKSSRFDRQQPFRLTRISKMVPASTETADSLRTESAPARSETADSSVRTPADVAELMALVAECAGQGTPVYPAGGGTSWAFGGAIDRSGVRVETSRIDRVIDYPVDDMTITVEAGMTLGRLQSILAENNQYLPIDPPKADLATLGGMMATGWTGPRRQLNLKPRDQVIGIAFVDGLGQSIRGGGRVVKNVAGYDFPKLLTGSLGALGVISELTFKVRPRPESTAIAWIGLPDASAVEELLDKLNLSATRPTAIEVMDRSRAEAVGTPQSLKASGWVVAVGFDESSKAIAWQCEKIREELPATATCEILTDDAARSIWASLTEGFESDTGQGFPVARVVTRPGKLAAFLHDLDVARWSVQAHGGQGIAMIRAREPISREFALTAANRWLDSIESLGGSVIWPECPEDWKPGFPIWGRHRPEHDTMAGIKRALDPKGILNPGRFLGLR